jgi:hypothetical protein
MAYWVKIILKNEKIGCIYSENEYNGLVVYIFKMNTSVKK